MVAPTRAPDKWRQAQDNVREFLGDGLRQLRREMQSPEKRDHPYHHGYLEGSRRLAKDLCRRLDIAWDDSTDAPKKDGP